MVSCGAVYFFEIKIFSTRNNFFLLTLQIRVKRKMPLLRHLCKDGISCWFRQVLQTWWPPPENFGTAFWPKFRAFGSLLRDAGGTGQSSEETVPRLSGE